MIKFDYRERKNRYLASVLDVCSNLLYKYAVPFKVLVIYLEAYNVLEAYHEINFHFRFHFERSDCSLHDYA